MTCYDARMTCGVIGRILTRAGSLRNDILIVLAVLLLASGCGGGDVVSAAPAAMTAIPPTEMPMQVSPTPESGASTGHDKATATPAQRVSPLALPTPTPIALLEMLPTPTPTAQASTPPVFAPTPDGVARQLRVPILMYHYLSMPPADADIYRKDLSVAPELFAAHLDRLLAEGYTTVNLYELIDALERGAPLPEKPVVITFDDGYRDNYENAFPLLKERGMLATIFVVTDFIDEQRPEYLTWDMAREMVAQGVSIEAHGRNHVSLAGRDDDYLVWQALGSLETIQYELGTRPRFVSYPAGDYDQRTIDIFKSANYWAGVTTIQGATLDSERPFELPRIRVRSTTSPDDLIRLLSLDW